jgi:hypothetical protein
MVIIAKPLEALTAMKSYEALTLGDIYRPREELTLGYGDRCEGI